jgi:YbbR domain-containing protein
MIQFLRGLFFTDVWLKLFSLTLAFLIWVAVTFAIQQNKATFPTGAALPASERVFPKVPVTIMSSAEDVRAFTVEPKEIEVTVQGMANTLQSLKPTDIHVTVDLSDAAASHLTSKRVEISVPAGVSHVRVFPAEVHIMFPSGR